MMWKTLTLIGLLWSSSFGPQLLSVVEARKSGGGSGTGRGGGAARTGGGGHSYSGGGSGRGGSSARTGGGSHPPSAPSGSGGRAPTGGGGGYRAPSGGDYFAGGGYSGGSFSSGTGLGSSKSGSAGTFMKTFAGAAAGTVSGLLLFEAGKAILQPNRPISASGHDYYFDEMYAKPQGGQFVCSMPLQDLTALKESGSEDLSKIQFANGTKPRNVVFTCRTGKEVCCGMDCCPAGRLAGLSTGEIILIILGSLLLLLLIAGCCFCFLAYQCCRATYDALMPSCLDNGNDQQGAVYQYNPPQDFVQQLPAGVYAPSGYPAYPTT